MAGAKHGPNRFDNYQSVHETVMQQLIKNGFVVLDGTVFSAGAGFILLEGRVECLGNIVVDVRKTIQVLSGDGPAALVQTRSYSYNVLIRGRGNLFRYDSPDLVPTSATVEHHKYHHKHVYSLEPLGRQVQVVLIENEDDIPTLGEVLREAEAWYYDHIGELDE